MKRLNIFRFILMLMILIFANRAQAQFRQFGIGGPDNEVAIRIRTMPDGSGTIIAGYRYNPLAPGATDITNAQMILLKVNPSGTSIIWQQEFGVPSTNNLIQDMLITHDDDIVVVGTMGRNGLFQGNNAAILKFDGATGALQWQNSFNSGTVGGELFFGVTELGATRGHAIVAIGAYDQRPSIADNLISIFDNATGAHLHSERHCANSGVSESYNGICTSADGESVYVVGSFRSAVFGDGVVRMFDISATNVITLNWAKYFNFVLTGVDPQTPLVLNNNTFAQVFLRGDRLLIMGGSLNAFAFGGGHGESIMRLKAADGTMAELWQVQHDIVSFSGPIRMYPINTNDVINVQSPSAAWYDPIMWLTGVMPNSSISVDDLTASTAVAVEVTTNGGGLHSLFDLDANLAAGNYYFGGCTTDTTGFGNNDIYFVDLLSSSTNEGCEEPATATVVPVIPTEVSNAYTVNTVSFNSVTVNPIPTNFDIKSLCSRQDTPHFECDNTSFDETLTDLTYTGSYTDSGGCAFIVTATGITAPGWSIIGYLWTYGGGSVWDATTSSTDVKTITLTYSGSDVVHVKYFAVNANGDTCYTDRSIKLHCKRPPCYFDTCSKLTVTQLFTTGGGTTSGGTTMGDTTSNPNDDSCTFVACVDVCTAYTILGYSWTLSNGTSVTHHTSSGHDCWTFRLGPGESVTVSVVAHIIDPHFPDGTDPCCRAAFQEKVSCGNVDTGRCNCFDETLTSLSSSSLLAPAGFCRFKLDAIATLLNENCTITSYEWIEAGSSTIVTTSALSDTRIVTIPSGTSTTVEVYIHAVMPNGQECVIHKQITLDCNDESNPNCNCFDPSATGMYDVFVNLNPDGSCNFVVTGYTGLLGNCQPIGYRWTVNGLSAPIVYVGSLSENRNVTVPMGTTTNVAITFFAISPTGDTCTISRSMDVYCHWSRPAGDGQTGTKDVKTTLNTINVFPNPTNDNVTVESTATDIKTVEVIDVNGKKVGQYHFDNVKTANIPMQKLVPGAYMLKINSNTTKVIIKGSK